MEAFTPISTRIRLEDGRTGTRHKAPIDSLWSISLDDGEVIYCSILRDEPEYTVLD
jgi:hypothetical protein